MNIGILTEDVKSGEGIRATLEHEGHRVTWFASGQEAMACILNTQSNGQPSYDVMLVDLCLTGSIDGAEFISRVREMLPNTPTKFVLMASTHAAGYEVLVSKHLFDVHFVRTTLPAYDMLRLIEHTMGVHHAKPEPVVVVEAAPTVKPASRVKLPPPRKSAHGSHA